MSNYNVITDWDGKDALADSNPAKVISGDEFQDEFDAIATAVSTKADINGDSAEAFSAASLTLDGTAVTATAAELNILDGVTATATEVNKLGGLTLALNLLNGMTDGVKDEDDMASDSASALATQQSIKAYVDNNSSIYVGGGTATSGTDFSIQYGASGKCFVIGFGSRVATYGDFGNNTLQLRDGATSVDSVTVKNIEYDSRTSSACAIVMYNFTGGTNGATKTDVDLYWSVSQGNEDFLKYFYVGY